MRRAWLSTVYLAGCFSSPQSWIIQGTVVSRPEPAKIIVDHEAVPGLMDAMVMPFRVDDVGLLKGVDAGDKIVAELRDKDGRFVLTAVRVTGHVDKPIASTSAIAPVHAGEVLPATKVPVVGGGNWRIGQDQGVPTLLTFLYTTCPMPDFCPMVTSRLLELQRQLKPGEARLLALTIDPEHDTLDVLAAYAKKHGADSKILQFGRLDTEAMRVLATRAALAVLPEGGEVVHGLRWLVLDKTGKLIERYDDNAWPADRLIKQLKTGKPLAPAGSDGTISRMPDDLGPSVAEPAR